MYSPKARESLIKRYLTSRSIGWDGLLTFIFSNCLMIMTAGIFLLWNYFKVFSMAKSPTTDLDTLSFDYILVLGVKLNNNNINTDFSLRLNRALSLFQYYKQRHQIIILGGITHNNSISEAQAGCHYLLNQKVSSKQILLEDRSQHTLENLSKARKLIDSASSVVVSNRYHLYRTLCLAKGLNLDIHPIGAEPRLELSIQTFFHCLREAYFVHWYWSGKLWVFLTGNQASRARIT